MGEGQSNNRCRSICIDLGEAMDETTKDRHKNNKTTIRSTSNDYKKLTLYNHYNMVAWGYD